MGGVKFVGNQYRCDACDGGVKTWAILYNPSTQCLYSTIVRGQQQVGASSWDSDFILGFNGYKVSQR